MLEADGPSQIFAQKIRESTQVPRVTWLNHYSIQSVTQHQLSGFTYIGIDGTLLQLALRFFGHKVSRTSADLFLPHWLSAKTEPKILLIGGNPEISRSAAQKIQGTVSAIDGYEGLKLLRQNYASLAQIGPTIVICSLGSPLQESVALEIIEQMPNVEVFTAGGWLEQTARKDQYFPNWVHSLRLGWLLRIIREPKRLLKRYTLDALRFILTARKHIALLESLESLDFNDYGMESAR